MYMQYEKVQNNTPFVHLCVLIHVMKGARRLGIRGTH
jgi:hypothetical protein